jgi:HPt (histidine-containing phosphotransfer) domain-containing protein
VPARLRVAADAPPGDGPAPDDDPWWARCPQVTVDPSLVDRIPPFLDAVRDGARTIHEARRARDFERVRATARKLKVAARQLGFDEIQRLAGALERAGRTPDREAIRRCANEIDHYAGNVQVVYHRQSTELVLVAPAV